MSFFTRLFSLFFRKKQSPDKLIRKGEAQFRKENYLEAADFYRQALASNPLFVPAFDGLGKSYFRLGFREEAEREFAIAEGLENHSRSTLELTGAIKMGRAMLAKGMYKEAAEILDPMLKNHPRDHELFKIVSFAHKAGGNDKKARELYRQGLSLWPRDSDIYLQLGALEGKAGNKEEAERLNSMALLMSKIDADPNDADARYQMARIFFGQKNYGDAAEYLRQSVAIQKGNAEYWYFLGHCYHLAAKNPAAIDALKQAAKLAPSDPKAPKLLAQVYRFLGKFDESRIAKDVATVLEGGQKDASDPQQAAKFVKYLLSINQFDEAHASLEKFAAKWPDNMDLKLIQGRVLVKENKFQEAVEILKIVANSKEDWAEPHIWMALAYQKLGDKMTALAEGQLATRLAPKNPVIHRIYGDILRDQKKFGMAENAYETAENLKATLKSK